MHCNAINVETRSQLRISSQHLVRNHTSSRKETRHKPYAPCLPTTNYHPPNPPAAVYPPAPSPRPYSQHQRQQQ
jgi:hypothetical protein